VDEQEPWALRPRQAAKSKRSDRGRMEACRTLDPASLAEAKRTAIMREVDNGLMFILSTRCQWRANPACRRKAHFHDYFDPWTYDGTLVRIHPALYEQCREQAQRPVRPPPSSIVIPRAGSATISLREF
jgi:transposase